MKKILFVIGSLCVLSASAFANAFTAGDVVVYETESSSSLSSAAAAVDLAEYSPTGTLVQTIAMPTADSGSVHALTDGGSTGSDGFLTLSPNGEYLALAGYDAAVGTSSVVSGLANRTIGIVNSAGAVDTSTSLTGITGNNIRSAITTDGNSIWIGGAVSGTSGVSYTTLGASTVTTLSGSNSEEVGIYDGQLYASSEKSFTLATIGTGEPDTTGQTEAGLAGFPSAASSNIYCFYLTSLDGGSTPDTAYIAESASASAGQIQKYSLEAGTWVETGDITLDGVVGITGEDVDGTVDLFATTASKLYSLSDTSGYEGTLNGSLDNIASVANSSDDQFKGVAFAPEAAAVPEPATWATLISGMAVLVIYQYRRARGVARSIAKPWPNRSPLTPLTTSTTQP